MYTERGAVGNQGDFNETSMTFDGNWYTLDLSSIIPANATCVNIHSRCIANPAVANSVLYFRKDSATGNYNTCAVRCQVTDFYIAMRFLLGVGANRTIQYRALNGNNFTGAKITIRGWFTPG